jgi:hypothetical protein
MYHHNNYQLGSQDKQIILSLVSKFQPRTKFRLEFLQDICSQVSKEFKLLSLI